MREKELWYRAVKGAILIEIKRSVTMKTVDEHREEFETYYKSLFVIRGSAYGVASKHLNMHDGSYISEHAAMAWDFWFKSAMSNEK